MTELLKRWAEHEPQRCGWTARDHTSQRWVRIGRGKEYFLPHDHITDIYVLAAVIEAIEARRLGWAVIRANGVDGITGMVEGGDVARTSVSPDPAEALLTAYLRFLDDQVVP